MSWCLCLTVERGDPGILSQHENAARRMQVGPQDGPDDVSGTVQSQTDACVLRSGGWIN